MTTFPKQRIALVEQRGVVSVAIALVLMLILAAAVTTMNKVSSSSVVDSAKAEEQVSAFFLAESGLERAQAVFRSAALLNSFSNTTCTSLVNQSVSMGRGSFTYTGAVSTPATCASNSVAPCTRCVVTVRGNVGTSARILQSEMIAIRSDGVTGQTNSTANNTANTANTTPNVTLNLRVLNNNSFVFTHLIFNPTTNWGGVSSAQPVRTWHQASVLPTVQRVGMCLATTTTTRPVWAPMLR